MSVENNFLQSHSLSWNLSRHVVLRSYEKFFVAQTVISLVVKLSFHWSSWCHPIGCLDRCLCFSLDPRHDTLKIGFAVGFDLTDIIWELTLGVCLHGRVTWKQPLSDRRANFLFIKKTYDLGDLRQDQRAREAVSLHPLPVLITAWRRSSLSEWFWAKLVVRGSHLQWIKIQVLVVARPALYH